MNIRITVLLMTAIGGLVAIAVSAVLFVSAAANVKNTLELLGNRTALTVSLVDHGIADYVSPSRSLVAHMRRLVADDKLRVDDDAQLLAALRSSLAAAPQIAVVLFLHPNGSGYWITRSPDGDIETNAAKSPPPPDLLKYISETRKSREITWGNPHVRNGHPVMTISGALFRGSEFAGVVGAGLSLLEMSELLKKTVVDSGMTGFVLYGDDKVLAHPALLNEEIRSAISPESPLLDLDAVGDPVLAAFPGLEVDELPDSVTFEVRSYEQGDVEEVVFSRKTNLYGDVPWRFGVHVPTSAVAQQLRRLIGSIGVGLLLLLLGVVTAIFLARRIARPIRAISSAAGQVASLEIDKIKPLPRSRIRELDEQSRAFNRMVTGLRWFETYVPRSLVNRLMEAPDGPSVGHREAELTVMFTDIIGFTPLSESMSPDALAGFLNHHFDDVSRCIEAEHGTLDKYIGDAVMAFWGAPEPFPDHAARACRAALAMLAATEERVAKAGDREARIKIAIHTGPLIVGNIGAAARMNYTVIGDTVNVASRIEKLCGEEDDGSAAIIIVSNETKEAAGEGFNFEALGERSVKGRNKAVKVWRLRSQI